MAISLRAARALIIGDVSLLGNVIINPGSTETYTITDYSSFSTWSVSSNVGTVSIVDDTITLSVPNPIGAAQVNLTVVKDGKPSVFVVAAGTAVVNKPSITSPTAGQTNVSLTPTIAASAYSTTPTGQGVHQSSQWQIALDSNFLNIAYDSGVDTVNLTSITVPGGLNLNTVYYVRVRYTSSTIGNSVWSTTVSFTTTNQYVNTPTVSVTGGPDDVAETPTITTSVC